jgi:hypothetical protein
MGRYSDRSILGIAIALCLGQAVYAQSSSMQYRLGLGYAGSPSWQALRETGNANLCPCDGRGESFEHRMSVMGGIAVPQMLGMPLGISASFGAVYANGTFRSEPYNITPWYDQAINGLVFPVAEFRLTTRTVSLSAAAEITLPVTVHLTAGLGAWMQHRLSGDFSLTEHLLQPTNQGYSSGPSRTRALLNGELLAALRTSWGPMLTFAYRYPLTEAFSFEGSFTGMANAEVARTGASLRALGAGLGFAIVWSPIPEEEFPDGRFPNGIPTPRGDTAITDHAPGASIDMFTVGTHGERVPFGTIRPEQHYTREKVPFFPVIYFDRNSSQLPSRYRQIPSEETRLFGAKASSRASVIDQYYDVLNLLGQRLREHPEATLTLSGASSPDEPGSIAAARAESVQMYLRNVWDIKASRLKIEIRQGRAPRPVSTPSSQDDFHVVDCSSSTPSILEPMTGDFAIRQFHTAPIRLNPVIRTENGVKEWNISITYKDKEVAHYSSDNLELNKEIDVSLFIKDADGAATLEPLNATLTVRDSSGRTITARDVLDFKLSHDLFPADQVERVSVSSLYVMPSPLSTIPSAETRSILKDAAAGIRNGDRVRIYPLLERTGGGAIESEQETRRHVQHLANLLMIELGRKKAQIMLGPGEYSMAHDARLPELAYLSSLLCIMIEHESK